MVTELETEDRHVTNVTYILIVPVVPVGHACSVAELETEDRHYILIVPVVPVGHACCRYS